MPAEPQRTAVVTGANRGIGRETAKQLAEHGLHVVVTGRDESAVRTAAAEIATETDCADGISHHALDVADPASVQAFRDWIERERGRVDVLVNNAGVYLDEGVSFFDVDEETVRRTLEINLQGPLRLCQAFVPGMRERGWGRVVNVSSGYGSITQMGGGGPTAYKISKAALGALTRIVAGAAGPNVKVNAVDPGWVRTRMGGAGASRSVRDAAADLVWAATLPDDGPTDSFLYKRQPRAW